MPQGWTRVDQGPPPTGRTDPLARDLDAAMTPPPVQARGAGWQPVGVAPTPPVRAQGAGPGPPQVMRTTGGEPPDLLAAFNPMTSQGQRNWAATGAAIGASALARRPVAPLPFLLRATAAPVAAEAATWGTAAVQPGTDWPTPGVAASTEFGGQGISAVLRRPAKQFVAGRVGRQAKTALEETGEQLRATGRADVNRATDAARVATRATREAAEVAREAVTTQNAQQIAAETARLETLLSHPPSVVGTGTKVKAALAGLGGMPGKGPARQAIDAAGEAVEAAAQTGPPVNITPLKTTLATRVEGRLPETLTDAVPQAHPIHALLARVQSLPDTIDFADAHQLKRLLSEAIDFDQTARTAVEGLTKSLRSQLQTMLGSHAPYARANEAFAAIARQQREGIGARLIADAAENPDRLAKILSVHEPANARSIRAVLVGREGDAAWDAIRSQFAYRELVNGPGGPLKLGERLSELRRSQPEFFGTVFGDAAGQRFIRRLQDISDAIATATTQAEARTAATTTSGRTAVRDTADRGRLAVRAARETVADTRRANQQEVRRLGESSLGPWARFGPEHLASGAAQAAGVPGVWGQLDALRFIRGVKGSDLLHWAAQTPANTQRLVRFIMSPQWERGHASLIRGFLASQTPPQASHAHTEAQP